MYFSAKHQTHELDSDRVHFEWILDEESLPELLEKLDWLIKGEKKEISIRFDPTRSVSQSPENWLFYVKIGPGAEIKSMVAHPDHESWVGTLILGEAEMAHWRQKLEDGTNHGLRDLGALNSFSNLRLDISF